jgi:hypothetical protein
MGTPDRDRGFPSDVGEDKESDVLQLLRAYHSAMVDARLDDLATILADNFSLVHITGYVQPRGEWFDVIGSGQFQYHRIDIDEALLSVSISGNTATVKGRGVFDATINGMRRSWRLQFAIQVAKDRGAWRMAGAQYTTF